MQPLSGVYLKPLLQFSKEELKGFLAANNYEWREDISNQQRVYQRNKVRLDLIPLMNDLAGGSEALEARILGMEKQNQYVSSFVQEQLPLYQKKLQLAKYGNSFILQSSSALAEFPQIMMSQILFKWIQKAVDICLPFAQLDEVLRMTNIPACNEPVSKTLSKEWDLTRLGNELHLVPRDPSNRGTKILPTEVVELFSNSQLRVSGDPKLFEVLPVNEGEPTDNIPQDHYLISLSSLIKPSPTSGSSKEEFIIRFPLPGDVVGCNRHRKISQLFTDKKVPVNERKRIPILFHKDVTSGKEIGVKLLSSKYFSSLTKADDKPFMRINSLQKMEPFNL
jgi:tRNA(Ile)-lysidine synthetase-like protein